jgi:D-xylose transport system substrate-binding protein
MKHQITKLALGALVLLCACEPKVVKVGVAMDIVDGRWAKDREFIQEKITELGGEAIFKVSKNNEEIQERQVQELIDADIDVLIIVPCNSQKAASMVAAAKEEDIKVIAYDRLISNADLDMYVTFDNMKVGEMQANYLLSKVPKGNYVLLGGSPSDNNAKMFKDGQMKALDASIKSGDVKIVYNGWANAWNPDKAYEQVLQVLASGVTIDAILASNDMLATGAIRAMKEKQVTNSVVIVGQDADRDACRRIANQQQAMTIYKPVKDLAFSSAVAAVMLANEQPIPNMNSKTNNGKKDVPSILLPPVQVDEHNIIQTVVADGFVPKQYIYGESGRPKKKEVTLE